MGYLENRGGRIEDVRGISPGDGIGIHDGLRSRASNGVRVQIPPWAPKSKYPSGAHFHLPYMTIKKYTIHPEYGSPLSGHPVEDSYISSDKYPIGIIADGITLLERNPDGSYPVFPDGQSGPKKISDIFCQKALLFLENQHPHITPEIIQKAFQEGNIEVAKANQKLLKIKPNQPNYGADAFATVAAITCLVNDQLIYGFLTDCGVAVVGKNTRLKFLTPEIWSRIKYPSDKRLQNILRKAKGNYRHYRNLIRNNPKFIIQGKFYSHGAINGQSGAIKYVEVGQKKLGQGDTVVIFTDGFRHYFKHKNFLKILSQDNLDDFQKKLDFLGFEFLEQGKPMREYGLERSLILIRR